MTFKEDFIGYLWQFQQFTTKNLKTLAGQDITVLKTGFLNTDAGPDFQNARIVIDGIEWAGNIELHVKASDWYKHNHDSDAAYQNVVLHVVWDADQPIQQRDGTTLPTLELKKITDKSLIERFKNLLQNNHQIPCQEQFGSIDGFYKTRAFEKALVQRVENKAAAVLKKLSLNNNDWEQTTFELLARNFGFKINAEPFEQLAKNLPLKFIQKHHDSLLAIEAMLFGLSGLMPSDASDEYSVRLRQEFDFYKAKFSLEEVQMNRHEWKFLRLRPANFPTVRMAQLAMLLHQQQQFFSKFITIQNFEDLAKSLAVEQSSYWQQHYDFAKTSNRAMKGLGRASVENLIVNTVVPLLFAYGEYLDEQNHKDTALSFLESIPAEKNHITDFWQEQSVKIKTAFDAQGSIELFNAFCSKKQCLKCSVGLEILKS
jgi:hypothetical protein